MRACMTIALILFVGSFGWAQIVISDCDSAEGWTGKPELDTEHVRQGAAALKWDFSKSASLGIDRIPHDWTAGNALDMWMFSAKATGSPLWIILSSENEATEVPDYFWGVLRVDFTGWRHIVITFKEIEGADLGRAPGKARKPLGWHRIDSLTFHAAWNPEQKIDPETVVTIDDIRVVKLDPGATRGPRLTDADFFDRLDFGRPELAAVKSAVAKRNYKAAKRLLAEHLRGREKPAWFTNWRDRPKAPTAEYDTGPADKCLAHEFSMIDTPWKAPARIDWSYSAMTEGESSTLEWNAQLNRHFHFKTLADAYWNTGRDEYAREIADQMTAWIEDCPVLQCLSGNGPYHYAWETLNTACRISNTWPDALFRCLGSPAFTDEALVKIMKSFYEQAEHLVKWPSKANWLTAESYGVFTAGTMFPEFRRASEWRKIAVERLYGQLEREVYPDGLQIELALGYNNWVIHEFTDVLKLAQRNEMLDEIPGDYLKRVERMYNYQLYAMRPDHQVFGFNDSRSADPTPLLQDAALYFPERQDFQWGASRGQRGIQPPDGSVAFPYSGHYVMRTGWTPQDLLLHFDAGPFGSGHQHEDKLGFQVYGYGNVLLTEGGVYMYDASRWRRYVLSTRGHNTVRVDDQDQRSVGARESWVLPYPFQPLGNLWLTNSRWDLVEGSYDFGYGDSQNKLADVRHARSILFVKPDYWIITDTMVPADDREHRYEAMFHFAGKDAATDRLAVSTGGADAGMQIVPGGFAGLTVQVVKGTEEDPVQGWAQEPWRAVPTALYHWAAKGISRVTYVLYPTPAGGTTPVSPVTEVKPIPVTTTDGKPANAAAAEIRFRDGSRNLYLYADKGAGLCRFGGFTSDGRCALIAFDAKGKETRRILAEGTLLKAGKK